jgi:hypothetical protein
MDIANNKQALTAIMGIIITLVVALHFPAILIVFELIVGYRLMLLQNYSKRHILTVYLALIFMSFCMAMSIPFGLTLKERLSAVFSSEVWLHFH